MAATASTDAKASAAFGQAVAAARQGDLPRARQIAEAALASEADSVALHAFLGMVEAQSGNLPGAVPYLAKAHALAPEDITIALNLIAALIDSGEHRRALDVASVELAARDRTLRIARYRAFAAQVSEEFEQAVATYEQIIAASPDDFESWNNLGNARVATGDANGAVDALKTAATLDPRSMPTRLNLAWALRDAQHAAEAETTLRAAAADFPDDARPWHAIYVNAKRDRDSELAAQAIRQAAALDPTDADLQLKLAVESGILHHLEESEGAFEEALRLDPTLADAYLGLAIQYEHTNREEMFAPLIVRAERSSLDEGVLAFLRALELRRAGRFEEALAAISLVPAEIEPQRTAHTRGTILDRLGRSEEAFAAFEACNQLQALDPTDPLARAADLREQLKGEVATITPGWFENWTRLEPSSRHPSPAFLVGFPRSGTTLLDTFLMGHPDVVVMEEQPPLNFVDQMLGGLDALAGLDQAKLDAARDRYFEEVAKVSGWVPGKLLIDKSPLFLHKAALIHRLFPDARLILALRHPCDAVLSCFMSNFRLNSAMANFLRLDDTAEFYDLTFHHWERARDVLLLDVASIRYEDLIEDVEGTLRPLCAFLGLSWHAEMLEHRKTARSRGLIKTASYSQVVEAIYTRAAGRWTRYSSDLEPILATLRPWVTKFGYSP